MDVKYVIKDDINAIGIRCDTSMKENKNQEDMPKLWCEFMSKIESIPNRKDKSIALGACHNNQDCHGDFTYYACTEVTEIGDIPEGMEKITLPKSNYAVFTHKGKVEKLGETYEKIFNEWIKDSEKELNTDAYTFELYDERYSEDDSCECDIYVAIK